LQTEIQFHRTDKTGKVNAREVGRLAQGKIRQELWRDRDNSEGKDISSIPNG